MPIEQTSFSSSDAVSQLKKRLSHFETEEGRLAGLDYRPKSPEEVLITTTPKAGTTWMQQICHQLRSSREGGDMSFSEISEVVPWLELAHDQGQELCAPQYGEEDGLPRLFKTHAWEPHCPKGAKVIVVIRDPMDVLISFYKFFEGWFFEEGAVSIEEFAREFWLARGVPSSRMNNASYFDHLLSWYEKRNSSNVLIVFFENLKNDLARQVRRVAKFISTPKHIFCTDEIINCVVQRSSYEFMKEHSSQFDEKLSKLARNEACGLPSDAGFKQTKLNLGRRGSGLLELPGSIQQEVQQRWTRQIQPVTGCGTYQEFLVTVTREQETHT